MGKIDKIVQTLAFFAYKQPGHTIDPMKAFKLMWLADRYHPRRYGRMVTGDTYFALPYGPVPSAAMDISNGCVLDPRQTNYLSVDAGTKCFSAVSIPDCNVFSDSDVEALNLIFDNFNHLSSIDLSRFSHEFPDWLAYEAQLGDANTKKSYRIDPDLFFQNPKKTSHQALFDNVFNQSEDMLEVTKEIFSTFKGA